ncbi:MAG: 2Fe-2S iron-sulfur cluster-binding protein [Halanaerobiaceae bacterium]
MSNQVMIEIEGKSIEAKEGEILLKVARENGIDIPGLCFHPRLTPTGACRLCVVKINDNPNPVPACNVKVSSEMKVVAFDEELESWRRKIVDLLFSEHDCSCINCDAAGDCELQDLAYKYGLIGLNGKRFKRIYQDTAVKYKRFPFRNLLQKESEEARSYFSRQKSYNGTPEDCIRCGFCIEVCSMNLYPVLMMEARELSEEYLKQEFSPEDCITCGMCSYVCPAKIRLPRYFKLRENNYDYSPAKD